MRATTFASVFLPTLALGFSFQTKAKRDDTWGGAVSLGPTTSTIIHTETTLIPGRAPATQTGELFLWPGMSNGTGDLVQTTLESWPDNSWCGAETYQWCIDASLFGSFGQYSGNYSVVDATDEILIVYNLESDNETWTQTVTNAQTGASLSYFSYASGPYMRGWGTGTECDDSCSGTIDEQIYWNTTIHLAGSDPDFGNTIATSAGATYTGLTSNEDSSIWYIEKMTIPAMDSS